MKYKIFSLGCKVNNYESEYVSSLLEKEGYSFSHDVKDADIIVVNTCTVTNNADKKCKKLIRSIKRENENAILVVMGCYSQYVKGNVIGDIVLGNKDKSKIIEYINEYKKNKNKIVKISDMNNEKDEFENMEIKHYDTHTRAFVKIEDGCNNFCSYCIIPYVRGRVRSKDKDKVINEVKTLVNSGHKEIVLTGIHTGQYQSGEYNLSDLLNELIKIDGLYRLRLSSIEVVEVNDKIIELLKSSKILVSHMHIPLQSGSDVILRKMNRRYNKEYFLDKINEIRKVRPNINITTDVIVGFNYETDELFKESYEFCKEIKFGKIHVFPYSERNGTKASTFEHKINEMIKKERVNKLLCLSKEMEYNYYEQFIGKDVEFLIEEVKNGYSYGFTENYIKVRINKELKNNQFYKITLKKENLMIEI